MTKVRIEEKKGKIGRNIPGLRRAKESRCKGGGNTTGNS